MEMAPSRTVFYCLWRSVRDKNCVVAELQKTFLLGCLEDTKNSNHGEMFLVP